MANDFVDGVVSADVFTEDDELASVGEESGSVEAAGFGEDILCILELLRECVKQVALDLYLLGDRCDLLVDAVDRLLAAESA